jgi:uncharacterized protein
VSGGTSVAAMLGLGLAAGVIGGMFGIGGGLIMVPALALLFGFDTKTAIGTSLCAQLLPVGVLGVREYWVRGEIDISAGLWIALGLLFGAMIGAKLTGQFDPGTMKRAYGAFLVCVGVYFFFATPSRPPAPVQPSPAKAVTLTE